MPLNATPASKHLANTLLVSSSATTSELVNTLSMWLLGGFAAGAAVLTNTLGGADPPFPAELIREALILFLASLALAMFQRIIAMWVAALGRGSEIGFQALQRPGVDPGNINLDEVFAVLRDGVPWPVYVAFATSEAHLRDGDLTFPGRLAMKLTILQGLFLVGQLAVLAYTVLLAARSLAA